jgi:hypothetical protein
MLQNTLPLARGDATIFGYMDAAVQIRSYGNVFDYNPQDSKLTEQQVRVTQLLRAAKTDAWRVLWQRLANDRSPGRRFVVEGFAGSPLHHERFLTLNNQRCDGIILDKPWTAVAMTSRDCPILTLYRRSGGPVAVLHCSRSSLQGTDIGELDESVINRACKMLGPVFTHAPDVCGILTLGIASEHFHNERYPYVIAYLRNRYGAGVIGGTEERPTIDLLALVRAQLAEHGIKPEAIVSDGLDTFTDTRLASVRAQRGGHNLVFVLRQK